MKKSITLTIISILVIYAAFNTYMAYRFDSFESNLGSIESQIDNARMQIEEGRCDSIYKIYKLNIDNVSKINKIYNDVHSNQLYYKFALFKPYSIKNELTKIVAINGGIDNNMSHLIKLLSCNVEIERNDMDKKILSMNNENSVSFFKKRTSILMKYSSTFKKLKSMYFVLSEYNKEHDKRYRSAKYQLIFTQRNINNYLDALNHYNDNLRKSQYLYKQTINSISDANNHLKQIGQYAKSDDIYSVYNQWNSAYNLMSKCINVIADYDGVKNGGGRELYQHLSYRYYDAYTKMLNKISNHRNQIYSEYLQAKQDESTYIGSAERGVGRAIGNLFGMAKQESNSKMGQEVGISVKALILGAEIFYDINNANSPEDLLTTVNKYQGDVNNLFNQLNEVESMKGPSITDLNALNALRLLNSN